MARYTGGCHCGRIRFEVTGELTTAGVCNCSICSKTGYLHWTVEPEQVRLLTEPDNWVTYRFLTRTSQNRFCPVCGVSPFRIPRSDPDKITVNLRCLDGVDVRAVPLVSFDGQNWEDSMRAERGQAWREGE